MHSPTYKALLAHYGQDTQEAPYHHCPVEVSDEIHHLYEQVCVREVIPPEFKRLPIKMDTDTWDRGGRLTRGGPDEELVLRAVDDSGSTGFAVPLAMRHVLKLYREYARPERRGRPAAAFLPPYAALLLR